MPQRLNVMGPGEFIRMHLLGQPGQRDYIGGMFRAYKQHLVAGGVNHVSCRGSFGSVIWMLKETEALRFDGAEAVAFGGAPPAALPPEYQVASPAPRHYYSLVDPEHPAFDHPRATWQAQRGLPVAPPKPRVPRVRVPRVVAPSPAEVVARPAPPRRLTAVERLLAEGRPFRERIEQLRLDPDPEELEQLERDQLDWFDRVLDAAERATGADLTVLVALGERLEAAAAGFETARTALLAHQQAVVADQPSIATRRMAEYLAALEVIETCCP